MARCRMRALGQKRKYRPRISLSPVQPKSGHSGALSLSVLLGVVIETRKNENDCESCGYMTIMETLNNNVIRTLASVY